MLYPLKETHDVLSKWLHTDGSFTSGLANSNLTAVWEEIQNFRSCFLQSAASVPSAESLKIWVHMTMMGCIDAMNTISLLQKGACKTGNRQAELLHLDSSLNNILEWLRTCFGDYANDDMAIPVSLAEKESIRIRSLVSVIAKEVGASVHGEWMALIESLIEERIGERGVSLSFRQASYFTALLKGIREMAVSATVAAAFDKWMALLIRHNCNEVSLIRLIGRHLAAESNDILSLTDRLEKWQEHRKAVEQTAESGAVLYLGEESVKASLLSLIISEIRYLEGKERTLASVYGSRGVAPANSSAVNSLLTTLSVSQLAVWCRLLSDCGIIKHGNQTELLKMIAGALQTTRTATISAESLRVKYYAPDLAAINIVKEHLHGMLNRLNTY